MPTTDERREVAARLRDNSEEVIYESDPYGLLAAIAFLEQPGRYIRDGEIFNRLADLIEPSERTCEVKRECCDDLLEDVYTDLTCGHWVRGMAFEFSYCPRCGARVIGGQPR